MMHSEEIIDDLLDQVAALKAERDAAMAERDALRKAIRFLFDHGAYLTERVPDELKAAIDAARSET